MQANIWWIINTLSEKCLIKICHDHSDVNQNCNAKAKKSQYCKTKKKWRKSILLFLKCLRRNLWGTEMVISIYLFKIILYFCLKTGHLPSDAALLDLFSCKPDVSTLMLFYCPTLFYSYFFFLYMCATRAITSVRTYLNWLRTHSENK